MPSFTADLFDGRASRPHRAIASFDAARLHLAGEGWDFSVPLGEVRLAPPAGSARSIAYLPSGMELHSSDTEAMRQLSAALHSRSPERWALRLERRLLYALGALAVSLALIVSGLRWGVPLAAASVANALPASIDQRMGDEALALFDRFLELSQLAESRRQGIAGKLSAYCRQQGCPAFQLHFRHSGRLGANAVALPGGTIIVTDTLVQLAENDEEVLAVIAHELGHVHHRHSLRLAIQSVGAGAILVAITGDIGQLSDLVGALPTLLLQSGYSRDMEREADAYALDWLNTACISPQRFADLLQRIDKNPGNTGLLDSHPGSLERLERFRQQSAC